MASATTMAEVEHSDPMDSVEYGLITCSPHEEVYSLYGHSAIHFHDRRNGRDFIFNYGVFDYKKPHFIWRFIMGQTDYKLEGVPYFKEFCKYYRKWGSQVVEQVLDLTREEKQRLTDALSANLRNPVYRYNFFFDNCATRPRNIIEQCISGRVVYAERPADTPTFRQLIHEKTRNHPWSAFGNDLLLGFKADRTATQREQHFLPEVLRSDFDRATIVCGDSIRPLVKEHIEWVKPGVQVTEKGFPLSPTVCFLMLVGVSMAIFFHEQKKHRIARWWDITLMTATGLPGIILFLMLFSEHPATGSNLQILVLNPLSLLFIPMVFRRKTKVWFSLSLAFCVLFIIGGFTQDYAEGMEYLALCLLLRCYRHLHG